jgi:drug/metabolite transporter (DMT)-like permease
MQNSHFFKVIDENGRFSVNWINFAGLIIRTLLNIAFQISIILAFKNAKLASLNQGVITSLLSMYCVFTTAIFYFVFGE